MSDSTTEDSSSFSYDPSELKAVSELWAKEGWPIQLLDRDQYSAKILKDNDVFNTIKFFKHEWKWDDEDGLLILSKKTGDEELAWHKWEELLPSIKIKVNKRGEFKFENASYGVDGLEYEFSFQFTPSEFKAQLDEWSAKGWPVKFLLRDHYGAKVLYDNQVFPLIDFYGHEWNWDDELGLSILFKRTHTSKTELVLWTDIANLVPVCRTPQGWLLFDGWNYTSEGLVPHHLWQWKKLLPSHIFPPHNRPNYCYLDIVSFCWEHEGMQGFGIRTPHGHLAIELADDQGYFYSVGQYMDPRSKINTKVAPAATVRAVLMSPDPYMPSKGEKTVHRYYLGTGKEGREAVAKLRKHIEDIQDWKKDPNTGVVHTCGGRKYHMLRSNCGDFCTEIEEYAQQECGGFLTKISPETIWVPHRKMVASKGTFLSELWTNLWNRFILFLVDMLVWFAVSVPWLAKKIGAGMEDDFSDPYFKNEEDKSVNTPKFKPKKVKFPVRIRLEQLYSPRLRHFSAKLKA